MLKKWRFVVSASLVVIFSISSISSAAAASTPADIPARSEAEINYLLSQKIIQGYPDGLFHPQNTVTREEAVTMVGRAIGLNGTKQKTYYYDVPMETFGSGYIESARKQGLIQNSTTFRPKEPMTRGEMAFILDKAFALTDTSKKTFRDIPSTEPLAEAVNRLATEGIAGGYPNGTFGPNKSMTREEFSLFLARALNKDYRITN